MFKHGLHMDTSSGEILPPSLSSYGGQGDREIYERKGRGNEKGAGEAL
jgi:hypothetical protein